MSKTILKHQYKWFVGHVNNTNKNIQTGHILFKTSNNLVWYVYKHEILTFFNL